MMFKKLAIQGLMVLLTISVMPSLWSAETDLILPDLNGKEVKVSDYQGKWVIVNYWATWCPPCAAEIPELNAFHKKHQEKDAVVLGVNIERDDVEYVKEFSENFKIVYPILKSDNPGSSPYGRITGLPTTFIISRDGALFKKIVGGVTLKRLEDIINVSE